MRKIRKIALALAMTVLLTGCNITGVDPQNLVRPPLPTGEREKIHQVLEAETGRDYKLKYPQRGEYRSAIIMHDMDGDGSSEAIALYQPSDGDGVTVMFIGETGDTWKKIGSVTKTDVQIDQICFGDVNSDGTDEAIVGWGNALNNTNEITVYSCSGGELLEIATEQAYTEMVVMDFDGDGFEEIFTASLTNPNQQATARLFRISKNAVETMGTADMDATVTRYISVTAGLTNEDQYGVVLDGAKTSGSAATYVTELIYWDEENNRLQNPFYDPNSFSANYMMRYTSVVSTDINDDGVIEIPIVNTLPGYTVPAPDETCYVTNWHRYDSDENILERKMSMVINSREGYWFLMPETWRDKVTVRSDFDARTMTFYEWIPASEESQSGALGSALLKIQVFTNAEWASAGESFEKLAEKDNLVYAVSIPQPENDLSLRLKDISNSFELMVSQE